MKAGVVAVQGDVSEHAAAVERAAAARGIDAEDRNTIRIDPKTVVAFGVLFGVGVMVLNAVAL